MEEESHGSNYGETETSSSASTSDSILNSSDHSTHASRPAERITIYEEKAEEGEDSDCYVVCCKRLKHAPPITQDRISALPNSILLNILSSLPTKDAIKTGVLSKRWSYVWTSVPSLSFTDDYENTDHFATAVDNTLLLHKAPKLTKFYLRFNYKPDLKPRLDLWVRLATNAMVEQLSLRLTYAHVFNFETYLLPQHLYTNQFVSELDFSFCNIKPIGVVHLSSLKRLCIGYTALCGDDIRKVVMGSPRLEYLELNNCCRLTRLDIASESLKKLVINNHFMLTAAGKIDDPVFELEIVAPKIESLEILGTFCMKKCRIKDVSSLVKAKLDFSMAVLKVEEESACNEYQEAVRELLESLHHVKELFVGKWCLMVLSLMSVKHVPSPLLKCKYVTVKTSMKKWDLPGIASLLQSLPYVEKLVIDISHHNLGFKILERHYLSYYNYDDMSHWKSKEIYFKFLLLCLKTVKIFGFGENLVNIKEVFVLVVQFLLKNANVMEKMIITKPRVMQNQRCMLHAFLQVAQKLLSFPRSSPHAVIMFTYQ